MRALFRISQIPRTHLSKLFLIDKAKSGELEAPARPTREKKMVTQKIAEEKIVPRKKPQGLKIPKKIILIFF